MTKRRVVGPVTGSDLERAFEYHWRQMGGPRLDREYRFAGEPTDGSKRRMWRFDFAHLPSRVAIECEGGVWSRGRHVRGGGFEADVEKYNAAVAAGWRVYRLTARMLYQDPRGVIAPILAAVKERDQGDGLATMREATDGSDND